MLALLLATAASLDCFFFKPVPELKLCLVLSGDLVSLKGLPFNSLSFAHR